MVNKSASQSTNYSYDADTAKEFVSLLPFTAFTVLVFEAMIIDCILSITVC